MYEVILYAAIATVVCVLLYSVLGKSVGQGPESGVDAANFMDDPAPQGLSVVPPVIDEKSVSGLDAIVKADPSFTPAKFIDGAKQAYSMILEGFADGDKDLLKDLLTKNVYQVYSDAIDDRKSKDLTQVTDLARLRTAEIVEAGRDGKNGYVSVKYESELASALVDIDGNAVQGDPDMLSNVSEVWSFTRNLTAKDPNWRLSDVSPSEGDDLEADPTPDTKK